MGDHELLQSIGHNKNINNKEDEIKNIKQASFQKYNDEWNELYHKLNLIELQARAVRGELRTSRFRSICWRIFLNVIQPLESKNWLSSLKIMRENYNRIKQDLFSNPWLNESNDDDPLSQSDKSVWNQHFCDEELRSVIKQDVVRTFPGVDFFRKPSIQNIMVSILFVYARENPVMCYRQGMHELLAPLLFVFHYDHQAMLHTEEQIVINEDIRNILNPEHMEEDVYYLFSKLMASMESCYHINNVAPTASGYFPASLSPATSPESSKDLENEVVLQLNIIRDNLLQSVDPDLCAHLRKLDISLTLFGIRWLRLLFGREFPLQDLLMLWDVIFSQGDNFKFVPYIVVAMLVAIRKPLLEGDYTTCLMYLMRYPATVDVTYIIDHALHLQNPQKHYNPCVKSSTRRTDAQKVQKKQLMTKEKPKQAQAAKSQQLPRESSKIVSKVEVRNITEFDVINAVLVNDPEKLLNELKHARNVMALSRLKLMQYHKVLSKAIPNTESTLDARMALDGISELPSEIEPALEAGEVRPTELRIRPGSTRQHVERSRIEEMKLYACSEGDLLLGVPMIDPIHRQD